MKNSKSEINLSAVPSDYLAQLEACIERILYLLENQGKNQFKAEWLESADILEILGISRKTWQTYRDNRVIPFYQYGKKIYVKKSDLTEFMEKNYIPAK